MPARAPRQRTRSGCARWRLPISGARVGPRPCFSAPDPSATRTFGSRWRAHPTSRRMPGARAPAVLPGLTQRRDLCPPRICQASEVSQAAQVLRTPMLRAPCHPSAPANRPQHHQTPPDSGASDPFRMSSDRCGRGLLGPALRKPPPQRGAMKPSPPKVGHQDAVPSRGLVISWGADKTRVRPILLLCPYPTTFSQRRSSPWRSG